MKTAQDPRHLKRITLMQQLFTWEFNPTKKSPKDLQELIPHLPEIDELISKAAPDRPIGEINKVDLSILRNSIFEMIIKKDTPTKVVIDEAIELGKEFGSDSSPAFINGVLGAVVKLKGVQV